jgi:hypothetical protein
MPTPFTAIAFQQRHGAASRVGMGDTAFPHRYNHYNLYIDLRLRRRATAAGAATSQRLAKAFVVVTRNGCRYVSCLASDNAAAKASKPLLIAGNSRIPAAASAIGRGRRRQISSSSQT